MFRLLKSITNIIGTIGLLFIFLFCFFTVKQNNILEPLFILGQILFISALILSFILWIAKQKK